MVHLDRQREKDRGLIVLLSAVGTEQLETNTGRKNVGMAIRGKNPTPEDNPESAHDGLHAKRTG